MPTCIACWGTYAAYYVDPRTGCCADCEAAAQAPPHAPARITGAMIDVPLTPELRRQLREMHKRMDRENAEWERQRAAQSSPTE